MAMGELNCMDKDHVRAVSKHIHDVSIAQSTYIVYCMWFLQSYNCPISTMGILTLVRWHLQIALGLWLTNCGTQDDPWSAKISSVCHWSSVTVSIWFWLLWRVCSKVECCLPAWNQSQTSSGCSSSIFSIPHAAELPTKSMQNSRHSSNNLLNLYMLNFSEGT